MQAVTVYRPRNMTGGMAGNMLEEVAVKGIQA